MTGLDLYQLLGGIGIELLLGIAISSTLLCACGLLMLVASRGQSASTRFCIWQAASAAIVLSAVVLAVSPGVPLRTASVAVPAGSAIDQDNDSFSEKIEPPGAMPNESAQFTIPNVVTAELRESPEEALRTLTQSSATHVAPRPTSRRSERASVAVWWKTVPGALAGIWITVLACKMLTFARSVAACYAIARRASREMRGDVADALAAARQRIGLTQTPLLVISDEVSIPYTLGLVRPVVVLPALAPTWPADKLEMVIGHELAHIQRRDLLWHWIGKLAVCLAWFNPLVWLAARRGVLDRERACDDRVIATGVEAVEYGNCLVEIAAAMSGRTTALAAGVSMAEPPLKQRLTWILMTTTDRSRAPVAFRRLLTLVFLALATVLGVVRPLATAPAAPPSPAAEQASDAQPSDQADDRDGAALNDGTIELTKPVKGSVTDVDGNPIAGAQVVVKLIDHGGQTFGRWRESTIRRWETTTDATGTYSIDTSGLGKQPAHYCFGAAQVDKPGFAQVMGRYWPTVEEVARGESIKATKLKPGRKVSGRIVSEAGQPIGGIVKAAAKLDLGQSWWAVGTKIPDSGQIELYLPLNADAELVVYAADYAPKMLSVSQRTSDLGSITLSAGTRVTGHLVDLEDKPVAGAIVELTSLNHHLEGMTVSLSRVAVTDGAGIFTLAPAAGECRLSVVASTSASDQIGHESITGIVPPLVVPITIDLPAERGTRELTLRESESFTIKGTARWEDGQPAKGLVVRGGARGVNLAYATTDAGGNYQLELPQGSNVHVMAIGAYRDDERSVWYMARGSAPPPASGNTQIISIDKLSADLAGVDWELRPHRESRTATAAEQRAAEAFAALQQEERAAGEKYQAAQTPEERERLDPRNIMAPKYLAFEREFRGDKHAVQAIVEVLMRANSVGDPDVTVARARVEMVDRLIEHYLGHEELADTFRYLNAGPEVPRADTLLRLAAGRSPHTAVRAAALLARAERAKQKLRQAQQLPELEQFVASVKAAEPLGAPANFLEVVQRRLDELQAVDQTKLREQAGRWLDTIAEEYASEPIPNLDGHTFGTDAQALRFAIDRVIIGAAAPPFEAEDIQGKLFRLSDHRGQVVVLSFAQDIFDNAENLPHRSLAAKFADKPVKVVTIVATPSKEKFLASVKTIEYEGTLIWEPLHGPYQSRWGIEGFPTTFLVDATGKLLTGEAQLAPIDNVITKLLSD